MSALQIIHTLYICWTGVDVSLLVLLFDTITSLSCGTPAPEASTRISSDPGNSEVFCEGVSLLAVVHPIESYTH